MRLWQEQMERVVIPAVTRSTVIREILVAPEALDQAPAMLRRAHSEKPLLLIADENTYVAAGRRLEALLATVGQPAQTHVIPAVPRPQPTRELGEEIRKIVAASGAIPVAVGSGVLNDLVKYAAFQLGLDYSCVATAASMDGYASAGSPLILEGFKKTIQCRAPVTILADLNVIASAPTEMTGWGYGDLAGKVPAGGDWVLADTLGIEPIDTEAWPLVQDNLSDWLGDPDGISRGDQDSLAALFIGLTIAGLAMEFHGSSRPASGADHQIAHLWEMEGLAYKGEHVSHGACVSVATASVLGLYDWIGGVEFKAERIDDIVAQAPGLGKKQAEIEAFFGTGEVADRAFSETEEKHLEGRPLRVRLSRLASEWPQMSRTLKDRLLSRRLMENRLFRAGAPWTPRQIGVSRECHRRTMLAARFLRSRYTILDVLAEMGVLERAVDDVIGVLQWEENGNGAS